MRRILFTFIAAICLLIFLTTAALWVRSFWATDAVLREFDGGFDIQEYRVTALGSARGAIAFVDTAIIDDQLQPWNRALVPIQWRIRHEQPEPEYPRIKLDHPGGAAAQFAFQVLGTGVGYQSEPSNPQGLRAREMTVVIPDALVMALTAMLPALWLRSWRKRRAIRPEMMPCIRCGYSLIGNTTGVCPECGQVLALQATSDALER